MSISKLVEALFRSREFSSFQGIANSAVDPDQSPEED